MKKQSTDDDNNDEYEYSSDEDDESNASDVGSTTALNDDNKDEDDSDDDLEDGDLKVVINGQETTLLTWLRQRQIHIKAFHNAVPQKDCPGLKVTPSDYQSKAVGCLEYNTASPFKGALLPDPPGLGKTLMASMVIMRALQQAKRFSVVVVPSSLLDRWHNEFRKYYEEGTVSVFVLRDAWTSFTELLKYDVVITSYNFVMSQYRKFSKYLQKVRRFTRATKSAQAELQLPKRPNLSIIADALWDGDSGPFLVLDEAHLVKNPDSMTFHAINHLRDTCKSCIVLTGSPLDNTWIDTFALSTF